MARILHLCNKNRYYKNELNWRCWQSKMWLKIKHSLGWVDWQSGYAEEWIVSWKIGWRNAECSRERECKNEWHGGRWSSANISLIGVIEESGKNGGEVAMCSVTPTTTIPWLFPASQALPTQTLKISTDGFSSHLEAGGMDVWPSPGQRDLTGVVLGDFHERYFSMMPRFSQGTPAFLLLGAVVWITSCSDHPVAPGGGGVGKSNAENCWTERWPLSPYIC